MNRRNGSIESRSHNFLLLYSFLLSLLCAMLFGALFDETTSEFGLRLFTKSSLFNKRSFRQIWTSDLNVNYFHGFHEFTHYLRKSREIFKNPNKNHKNSYTYYLSLVAFYLVFGYFDFFINFSKFTFILKPV